MKWHFCRCPIDDEQPEDEGGPVVMCKACQGWIAVRVTSERDLELFAEKFALYEGDA